MVDIFHVSTIYIMFIFLISLPGIFSTSTFLLYTQICIQNDFCFNLICKKSQFKKIHSKFKLMKEVGTQLSNCQKISDIMSTANVKQTPTFFSSSSTIIFLDKMQIFSSLQFIVVAVGHDEYSLSG